MLSDTFLYVIDTGIGRSRRLLKICGNLNSQKPSWSATGGHIQCWESLPSLRWVCNVFKKTLLSPYVQQCLHKFVSLFNTTNTIPAVNALLLRLSPRHTGVWYVIMIGIVRAKFANMMRLTHLHLPPWISGSHQIGPASLVGEDDWVLWELQSGRQQCPV